MDLESTPRWWHRAAAALAVALGLAIGLPSIAGAAEFLTEPTGLDVLEALAPGQLSFVLPAGVALASLGTAALFRWGPGARALLALPLGTFLAALAAAWIFATREGLAALGGGLLAFLGMLVAVPAAAWAHDTAPGAVDARIPRAGFLLASTLVGAGIVLGPLLAALGAGEGPRFDPERVVRDTIGFGVLLGQLVTTGVAAAYAGAEVLAGRRERVDA
ncbi:hypothetical protein BRD56_01820 [Thermoplasmatales archaeon SW_10_69_26]|nr:MAG: hypothetical protein BRD56_01820 [Thermoplasmatales archaeon SW_10_69_26]